MTPHPILITPARPVKRKLRILNFSGMRYDRHEKRFSTFKTYMSEKIGFVGVGRMGSNMARRLKESGYAISAVYDTNGAMAQAVALELGSIAAEQLEQVTRLSDVIITVVTDDAA